MPRATVQQQRIVQGSAVLVTQNGKPLAAVGNVDRLDCGEPACAITVALSKTPGQTIDPDTLRSAEIELALPPSTVP